MWFTVVSFSQKLKNEQYSYIIQGQKSFHFKSPVLTVVPRGDNSKEGNKTASVATK